MAAVWRAVGLRSLDEPTNRLNKLTSNAVRGQQQAEHLSLL